MALTVRHAVGPPFPAQHPRSVRSFGRHKKSSGTNQVAQERSPAFVRLVPSGEVLGRGPVGARHGALDDKNDLLELSRDPHARRSRSGIGRSFRPPGRECGGHGAGIVKSDYRP
jgi:hypothetical protein